MKTTDLKNKRLEILCNMRHDWDEETQSWIEREVSIKPADYEIGNGFVGRTTSGSEMMDWNVFISREEALLHVSAAELKELGYN